VSKSRWGERGPGDLRTNGRTRPKAEPGTHNRRARRAAKARRQADQDSILDPTPRRIDEVPHEFAQRREARRRAEREAFWAGKTDADVLGMSLERSRIECAGLGGEWFLGLFLTAVPMWAHRHYRTDPKEREQRAHALGDVIAESQAAAAIADPDARGTERKGDVAKVFNALAEGMAIGAYCPGGTSPFMGHVWEVVGTELRVTNEAFCTRYPLDDDAFWAEGEAA
jgi:hypothetical protein